MQSIFMIYNIVLKVEIIRQIDILWYMYGI